MKIKIIKRHLKLKGKGGYQNFQIAMHSGSSPTSRFESQFFPGNFNWVCAKTAFSSAAWRFRPQRRRIDILLSMNEGIKTEDEQNLSPLDYHLQKYNFMINDSFVPEEKKIILFSHIYHSCAWNDNSLSFPYSPVLLNVFSSFFLFFSMNALE